MKKRTSSDDVAGLFDLQHYAVQAQRVFPTAQAAYAHFVAEGQARGLHPSPYFDTAWYAWQNGTRGHCVLTHFAEHARQRAIDPAPFVDTTGLLRTTPAARNALELYHMLLRGNVRDVPPLLDQHLVRLQAARDAFHARIELAAVRDSGRKRTNLVWVQCGQAFRLPSWFRSAASRDWDLLLNWYDLRCVDMRFGDVVLRQSGTKATGIHAVLSRFPEILTRYDAVLFLDDDLVVQHADLDKVFSLARLHNLDLFQPAVSAGSHCSWPHLFHRKGSVVRRTTGVEIMMCGFTRRALQTCAPLFDRSVSGFGLDFACSNTVRERGWSCGVIDGVQVIHPDSINEASGTYYEFMREIGINQKLELAEAIREYGMFPDFVTLNGETLDDSVSQQAAEGSSNVSHRKRCA
jgi:hypothetical protein